MIPSALPDPRRVSYDRTMRRFLIVVVILLLAGAGWALWIVLGPGPMDFAGGKRVALSSAAPAPGVGTSGASAAPAGAGSMSTAGSMSNPVGVPAQLAQASLVERGQYLSRAADCEACHSTEGGQPFAGGRAFVLPFGTMYSTNITPDPKTGIGAYTDAQFLAAMHKGIARDGTWLYPSMPYASYTYMTDEDALAIKAYLFSLPQVQTPKPVNTLSFPFNQRWLMSFWSLFFNPDKRFEINTERSAQWNRGAYLTEAMGHCGECHTPRNLFQALDNRRKFSGTLQAGWRAYNVTADRSAGIGTWSAQELAQYLALGHADGRGSASGPMGEAVDLSLRYLTPGDIQAIVAYVTTVPAVTSSDLPPPKASPAPAAHDQGVSVALDPRGKEMYEGECASCHDWTGISPVINYATLVGARSVNDPSATNVAQVVLSGTVRHNGHGTVFMPAFAGGYSDNEIAAVSNYVTARFGTQPSNITAANVEDLRKQTSK
jgi:mono/diheme cytochrome c family protein